MCWLGASVRSALDSLDDLPERVASGEMRVTSGGEQGSLASCWGYHGFRMNHREFNNGSVETKGTKELESVSEPLAHSIINAFEDAFVT